MKLIDLVNARDSLQKLIVQDLPIRTSYKLLNLVDECNKHLSFYGSELAKFDPKKDRERLSELDNMEIDIDMEQVTIGLDWDLKLSAGDVKMLMPLITFE